MSDAAEMNGQPMKMPVQTSFYGLAQRKETIFLGYAVSGLYELWLHRSKQDTPDAGNCGLRGEWILPYPIDGKTRQRLRYGLRPTGRTSYWLSHAT
jgi:hypothetical protein